MRKSTEERFWEKVEKTESCWNWTGGLLRTGYGDFSIRGRAVRAHRMSFEMAHGQIQEGMDIDHMCHNRACVRPSHLRVATRKENMENIGTLRSNNKSGVRGVFWNSRVGKWNAKVGHNGRYHHAGFFEDLADAEAAVVAKRNELYTHNILDRAA